MDDRTLIERAAKAAGYELTWKTGYCKGGPYAGAFINKRQPWRPLDDDGDIARLEADCEINVRWMALGVSAANRGCDLEAFERYAAHNGDKQKARRYASTRAAASLCQGGVVEPVAWRWRNSLGEVVTDWLEYQHQTAEGVKKQVADEGGTVEYAYATPQPSETQGRRQVLPLSSDELADCCGGCASNSAIETWMRRAISKFCEVNGIPASPQDEGGATV